MTFSWQRLYIPAWRWWGAVLLNVAVGVVFGYWFNLAAALVLANFRFALLTRPWESFWL